MESTVSKENLIKVLDILDGLDIDYWVDGGWGVDLLVGNQSRTHRDVDINYDGAKSEILLQALKAAGFVLTTDWYPIRMELQHPQLGFIDVHPLVIAHDGSAKQAGIDVEWYYFKAEWYYFKAEWFTGAVFEGRIIPCLSAEAQRLFHTGYPLREVDVADMKHLNEAFPQ